MSSSRGTTKSKAKAQSAKKSGATAQSQTGACKYPSSSTNKQQLDKQTNSPCKTTEYTPITSPPGVKHVLPRERGAAGDPTRDIKPTTIISRYQHTPSEVFVPPNRPAYGTLGNKLTVIINFFPIKIPEITIHQYDVKIYDLSSDKKEESIEKQTVDSRRNIGSKYVCRNVMNALSNTQLNGQYPAYDGRSILYIRNAIDILVYTVEWIDTDDGDRARQHEVVLKHTARVDLSVINELIQREVQFDTKTNHDEFLSRHQVATNAVDTLFRQFAAARYTPAGRGFYWYCKGPEFDLGSELELWEGFTQSARPGHKQEYLNINMSYRPFIKPWDLLKYLWEVLGLENIRDLCTTNAMRDAAKEISYLELYSEHLGHKRKYRVKQDQVFLRPANKETFQCDGKEVTVQEYFKNHHKMKLEYPDLPCIDVGKGDKVIALPMEVCYIKQGQGSKNEMTSNQKRNMVETTSVRPHDRQYDIKCLAVEMLPTDDPLRKYYNIETSDRMVKAECRQLAPPKINYQSNTLQPKDGKWQLGGYKLVNPIPVYVWAIIHFSEKGDVRYNEFINQIQKQARDKGIQMERPINENEIWKYYKTNLSKGLDEIFKLIKYTCNKFGRDLQLILCIIDRDLRGKSFNSDDIYNHIKLIGDSRINIVTQCIDQKNAKAMKGPTLGGVCLKINAKLGGTNHYATVDSTISLLSDTMILGADVNHPKPGPMMYGSPSIAVACVALDRKISLYTSSCRFQKNKYDPKHRQEIIIEFESMCDELFHQYTQVNSKLPKNILFYRDGVSESQFQFCLNHELPAIKRACMKLKGFNPKITLVCVQKRHNMRMFEVQQGDNIKNVNPGTYLDHTITHPYEYDFYLCSHAALKGTARAAHYHVLHDEIKYSPDQLYTITNQLCYCYSRCTKSVSIPPPVYYADLIAYRYMKYFDAFRGNINIVGNQDPDKIQWDDYRRQVDIKMLPGEMFWA